MARGTAGLVGRSLLWLAGTLGLLGAALLTVPRLIEPDGPRGVELVALTPFGLVPAVVLLLLAIGLAAIHRGAVRLLATMLALVGLVATALHVAWLSPLYVGSQARGSGEQLVVMTQNFEYGDASSLARMVRDLRVDVLVLCDMGPEQWTAVEGSSIPADLPHLADTEGGVVALSRYPMAEDRPMTLHGSGRSVRFTASPLGPVTLFALHPVQPYWPGVWDEDARRIVDIISSHLGGEPNPTIVAGDLNATLDNWPLRALQSLGLTDAVDAVNAGFQPTYPAGVQHRRWGISVPPLVQIDHVLVSRQLVVSDVKQVQTEGADHLGVVATLTLAMP